jgi:capsular polysaccharide transport system permease protein
MRSTDLPSSPVPAAGPRTQHLRVVLALMIRDMSSTYGKSVGGYFWSIAQPLGGIVLLAIAFSLALRTPPLGSSFMLFYATGIIPFTMYSAVAGGVAGAVSSNRGLLTYPVVSVIDAVLAKLLLTILTFSMIATILFAGIIWFFELHVNLALGPIARGLGMAALLGLGVGSMNCVLFGFFPTWKNIWGVLTRPLFILSGIFYTFESAPPQFQAVLWWNPLVHVIAMVREGVYGIYHPQFISYPYALGLALGGFVIGGYLLRRHASFLTER